MLRVLGIIVGAALVLLGVPLIPTPLPVGLVMVGIGVLILTASSPHFARWLARRRERHERLDAALDKTTEVLPDPLAGPLERTDPKAVRRMDRDEAPYRPRRKL